MEELKRTRAEYSAKPAELTDSGILLDVVNALIL